MFLCRVQVEHRFWENVIWFDESKTKYFATNTKSIWELFQSVLPKQNAECWWTPTKVLRSKLNQRVLEQIFTRWCTFIQVFFWFCFFFSGIVHDEYMWRKLLKIPLTRAYCFMIFTKKGTASDSSSVRLYSEDAGCYQQYLPGLFITTSVICFYPGICSGDNSDINLLPVKCKHLHFTAHLAPFDAKWAKTRDLKLKIGGENSLILQ